MKLGKHRGLAAGAVLTAVLGLVACGGSSTTGSGGTNGAPLTLTVGVPYTVPPIFAIIPAEAQRLGYFGRAGLNVKFVAVTASAGPVQLLVGGKVDVAAVFSPDAVTAYLAQGGNGVRFIFGYLAHAALLDTYAATKDIKSACDLKGKTLGVGSRLPSDPEYQSFEQLLQSCHIKDSQVTWSIVGTINQTIQGLIAGRINIAQIDIDDIPLVQSSSNLHLVRLVVPGTYRAWGYTEIAVTTADDISNPTKARALQIYTTTCLKLVRLFQTNEKLAMASALHYDPLLKGKSQAYLVTFWKAWTSEWAPNGMMNVPSIGQYLNKSFYPQNPKSAKVNLNQFVYSKFVQKTIAQIGVAKTPYFWDIPGYNASGPVPAGNPSL